MQHPDDDLLPRARAGDRAAIEALLARHQGDLRRFARRMCRTSEDAEDAVQHTMLQLTTHASTIERAARLMSWLFTVVKRECMRLVASVRREPAEDALDERLAAVGDPDVILAVEKALLTLDEPHRAVLLLRDVEELTGPEVAGELGISLAAMKSRLHRAREHLRATLLEGV